MFDVATLSAWDFWFWGGLLTLAFLASFYFAFRSLARARIIEDTPTSRIRSAHQGYVELNGVTEYLDGQALVAPLTNKPCCWYRYSIQKKSDKNWRTLESETSSAAFLLRDETGFCIIDPDGAEVSADLTKTWNGSTRRPPGAAAASNLAGRTAGLDLTMDLGAGCRYSEEWIPEGSPLYALGLFRSLDEVDHRESRRGIMLDLLRQWKQDPEGLLARFDRDRDGRIDPEEWERARESAREEAAKIHRAQLENLVGDVWVLTRPRDQTPLARRYRIIAAVSLGGAFLTGGIAAYLILARFLA